MEIRAHSVYTEETVKKYTKINLKLRLPLFLVINFLYFLIILNSTHSLVNGIVGFIIMTIAIFISFAIVIKRQYKMMDKFQEQVNYFLFRDNDFTISSKTANGEYNAQVVINYTFPVKVIETDFYLYIYTSRNAAYIIDKRTIENGTIDNIRCKLMPLLGKKYKIIR